MSARPDPFKVHVADQVMAALAGAGAPLSTPQLQVATGYGPRYGQLVYTVLTRLAKDGRVERSGGPGPAVYWRTLAPVICLPPLTVRTDQDGGQP